MKITATTNDFYIVFWTALDDGIKRADENLADDLHGAVDRVTEHPDSMCEVWHFQSDVMPRDVTSDAIDWLRNTYEPFTEPHAMIAAWAEGHNHDCEVEAELDAAHQRQESRNLTIGAFS